MLIVSVQHKGIAVLDIVTANLGTRESVYLIIIFGRFWSLLRTKHTIWINDALEVPAGALTLTTIQNGYTTKTSLRFQPGRPWTGRSSRPSGTRGLWWVLLPFNLSQIPSAQSTHLTALGVGFHVRLLEKAKICANNAVCKAASLKRS